jgi:two-component system OmpR family sensor kinase
MTDERAPAPWVHHLRRRLAWSFGSAWLLALGAMLGVSLAEGCARRAEQLDRELSVRATVVYGLTWFDDTGALRGDLLERESSARDHRFPVRAFSVAGVQVFGEPASPAFVAGLEAPSARLLRGELESWSGDVAGQRVHLLPLFENESDRVAGVACVSHPLATLRAQKMRFAAPIVATFVALALVGVGVAQWLSRRSVTPLVAMLDERERFLAGAAHELRTPLATIRAFVESSDAGDEPATVALARVGVVVDRAERSVDALLVYARLDAGAHEPVFEPVRIDLLVDRLVAHMPEADVAAVPVTAAVDLPLFELAIANLLANAERHGRARGGRGLRIALRPGHLAMEDRGPGFPPEVVDRRARRFGWTSAAGGHGIGLALATRVAEIHGGDLSCANTESGARVILSWRSG